MLIYKITNQVNGKVYIGQTTRSFEQRMTEHKHSANWKGVQTHLSNAIRKYGWESFRCEVICFASTQTELDALEQHYIAEYDSIRKGYNMIDGGSSANPMNYAKSKQHHDDVMRSDEVREKIKRSVHQRYVDAGGPSAEHRRKLSESKKRLYNSPEGEAVKAKFRASYVMTEAHKEAASRAKFKRVYCVDESGNTVRHFESVKSAAQWWYDNGYVVKSLDQLSDKIKESAVKEKYIKGLRWFYYV